MYSLKLNAVFQTKEELQELFNEVMEHIDNFGLDDWPNVGYDKLDFDILPFEGTNVYHFINKQRLGTLLRQTEAFEDYQNDYKSILENIHDYVLEGDINYYEIIYILQQLIQYQND